MPYVRKLGLSAGSDGEAWKVLLGKDTVRWVLRMVTLDSVWKIYWKREKLE